ncbi:methionyl-tRNA formyltransferase [Rubrobacter indicoceani]|uniref:methionyl-tRNA formyltransferase n=1 Tax=Rubrobacter indicoceani TaxID=2051957 RepID=UPI000E5AD77C|nr:methionyl-tRNA formyltransferase [Rubrobacter indicoceani]
MLRVAFAGTPDFAAEILRAMNASEHEIGLVVSQPDRRRGRGRKLVPTPVADFAREHDLPLLQPERISEANGRIRENDVLVVAAYGQILRRPTLEAARLGAYNVHASVLPKYRGAAPVERAIITGETETGISIMKMDEGLDTGPVARVVRTDIHPETTGGELTERLAALGGEAMVEVLSELEAGSITLREQDSFEATYASKVSGEDQRIDWNATAREVSDVVRALSPRIGARTGVAGRDETLKLWRVRPLDAGSGGGEAGRTTVEEGRILVWCGAGRVEVLELQAPGARRMSAAEFLRGNDISGILLR